MFGVTWKSELNSRCSIIISIPSPTRELVRLMGQPATGKEDRGRSCSQAPLWTVPSNQKRTLPSFFFLSLVSFFKQLIRKKADKNWIICKTSSKQEEIKEGDHKKSLHNTNFHHLHYYMHLYVDLKHSRASQSPAWWGSEGLNGSKTWANGSEREKQRKQTKSRTIGKSFEMHKAGGKMEKS